MLTATAHASTSVEDARIKLTSQQRLYRIDQGIHVYSTSDASLTAAQLLENANAYDWQRWQVGKKHFSLDPAYHWFSFTLDNHTVWKNWVVEFDVTYLDRIDFYIAEPQGAESSTTQASTLTAVTIAQEYHTGDQLPFSTRPISNPQFVFPVEVSSGAQKRLLIRIGAFDSVVRPTMNIVEANHFYETLLTDNMTTAVYFGAHLMLFVYLLLIGMASKEMTIVILSLVVLSVASPVFTLSGFGFMYVWPDSPELQKLITYASLIIHPMLIGLFARRFIGFSAHFPRLDRILVFFLFASLAMSVFTLVIPGSNIYVRSALNGAVFLSTLTLTIGLSVRLALLGNKEARIFSLSLVFYFFGIALLITDRLIFEGHKISPIAFYALGEITQILFLSYAISNRINKLKDEKIREKDIFLATVSHELRTPINGVMGALELIEDSDDKPCRERHELVHSAQQCAQQINTIVTNILDIASDAAQSEESSAITFSARQELNHLIDFARIQIDDKPVDLVTAVDPQIPELLVGDLRRWRKIISKLLDNAIKFTDRGIISVELTTEKTSRANSLIRCSVRDTGIGMDTKDIARSVKSFVQVESFYSRTRDGLGVGLAICDKLVANLGSQLNITSREGSGSKFFFSASFQHCDQTEIKKGNHLQRHIDSLADVKVLIVEDNPINQTILRKYIEKLGMSSSLAHNGHDAVEQAARHAFDVILMDCAMPGMNGFEATRQIRGLAQYKDVPIIAVTANAMEGDREQCLDAGMSDYLAKPANLDDIRAMLGAWLTVDEGATATRH